MEQRQRNGLLPPTRVLEDGEVHLWETRLDLGPERIGCLSGLLSEDEVERASRFRFARDRRHFIAARATLRQILGAYQDRPPEALQFAYSAYGKPELDLDSGQAGLHFNLSHAGGIGLYSVTRHRKVGVDIEYMRPDLAIEPISRSFFSRREREALESLPTGERRRLFFSFWTRKEAFLKALGMGFSFPPEKIDVSEFTDGGLSPVSIPKSLEGKCRWYGMDVMLDPGYAAAVVAEGNTWHIKGPFEAGNADR